MHSTERRSKDKVQQLRMMEGDDGKKKRTQWGIEKCYSRISPSRSWRNLSRMTRAISAGDRSTYGSLTDKRRASLNQETSYRINGGIKVLQNRSKAETLKN